MRAQCPAPRAPTAENHGADDEQLAVRDRGGVGGTGIAVQERDLAEDCALAEHIKLGGSLSTLDCLPELGSFCQK